MATTSAGVPTLEKKRWGDGLSDRRPTLETLGKGMLRAFPDIGEEVKSKIKESLNGEVNEREKFVWLCWGSRLCGLLQFARCKSMLACVSRF